MEPDALNVTFNVTDVTNGSQRVELLCGTTLVDTVTLQTGDTRLSLSIPGDAIDSGQVSFTFRFPDAISVYELSGFQDPSDYQRHAIRISGFQCVAE